MIEIKGLPQTDIDRIVEIDRSEHVTLTFTVKDGRLDSKNVDWQVPRWHLQGEGEHSVATRRRDWGAILDRGGIMLGAVEGDLLVGIGILLPNLTASMAQLAVLFVSNDYRRRGIATRLTAEMIQLAAQSGAKEIYVSATPSGSAVGFYQSQGFRLAEKVHPELFQLEPEDIHMIRAL